MHTWPLSTLSLLTILVHAQWLPRCTYCLRTFLRYRCYYLIAVCSLCFTDIRSLFTEFFICQRRDLELQSCFGAYCLAQKDLVPTSSIYCLGTNSEYLDFGSKNQTLFFKVSFLQKITKHTRFTSEKQKRKEGR